MKVPPLTKSEKVWLQKVQSVLDEAPERFEYYATGDPCLTVIDKEGARDNDIHDGAAERAGIVLANLKLRGNVHATTA